MENLEFLKRVRRLALVAMFSDDQLMTRLVLKGGNALDLIYGVSARASLDLDFSIEQDFEYSVDALRERIAKVLAETFREASFVVFDVKVFSVPPEVTEDMEPFWGGYKVEFKIIREEKRNQFAGNTDAMRRNAEQVGRRGSTRCPIEISKYEYCTPKLRRDFEGYQVFVYSPEMLVCEKLRAICQQMPEYVQKVKKHVAGRAQDFLDISVLFENFDLAIDDSRFQEVLRRTFAAKRVPLGLLAKIKGTREQHIDGFRAVRDTVYPDFDLKDFEYYFNYVVEKSERLKPLWEE
jgi:hypothetical protein